MNYLSIGGKSVIKNDQSKLTRWDVIIYDMEVPGKPFEECCAKLIYILYTFNCSKFALDISCSLLDKNFHY